MKHRSTFQWLLRPLLMAAMVVAAGCLTAAMAQVRTITGKITSKDDGLAMPGVNVLIKESQRGTSTNAEGKFTIDVSGSNAVLVFSFVGYTKTEVPVGNRSVVDVVMTSDASQLQEVVVTALGISREKKSLAYSISEVKSEDLVKAANPNVLKALDGKVSGVNLTNLSSDPTSSVLVNIRGTTAMPTTSAGGSDVSIKGQPLYVIDGVPVGTQTFTSKDGVDFGNILSQLNPNDIANITILKGGSAGALYGAEGGNGVVMITTKSGKGAKKRPGRFILNSLHGR